MNLKRTLRLFILTLLLFVILGLAPSTDAAVNTSTYTTLDVKNCVNIKTGVARYVSNTTKKCKTGEKLVNLAIPELSFESYSLIHSGMNPPSALTVGHDGDFYIDLANQKIYGPLTNGSWGAPINIAGSSGENGNAIISGIGVPSLIAGRVGDLFLDLTTYTLYGPKKESGDWGNGTSLIGPKGETGPQGLQGVAGIKGDKEIGRAHV